MSKKIVTFIINALVVLAILAVGLYGFKLMSNKADVANKKEESKTVLLTVEFEQYKKDFLENIEKGQEMQDSSKNKVIGKIKSVSPITDSVMTVSDQENGRFVKSKIPDYGMCSIVLECDGVVSPTSVTVGGTDVKIGSSLVLRTNDYVISGKVLGIDFE